MYIYIYMYICMFVGKYMYIYISGQILIIRRSLGRFIYFKIEIRFRSQEITNYFRPLGSWKRES